jgi:hypothetical protein
MERLRDQHEAAYDHLGAPGKIRVHAISVGAQHLKATGW